MAVMLSACSPKSSSPAEVQGWQALARRGAGHEAGQDGVAGEAVLALLACLLDEGAERREYIGRAGGRRLAWLGLGVRVRVGGSGLGLGGQGWGWGYGVRVSGQAEGQA